MSTVLQTRDGLLIRSASFNWRLGLDTLNSTLTKTWVLPSERSGGDRLFPAEAVTRDLARKLYASVRNLPIVSPHGHTQAEWFAQNQPFSNPAKLFVQPDHYIYRMLYSQGVSLEDLEIGVDEMRDPRRVWRIFATNYYLFRGTPTRIWLDHSFEELFGLIEGLSAKTADSYFDTISEKLNTPQFLPRALYDRFRIEILATTDSPLDSLSDHQIIRQSTWKSRIIPTFRPDSVVDPDFAGFGLNIARLGELTGENTASWNGYLNALEMTRRRFKQLGCTASDHGHPTARTADLELADATKLFERVVSAKADPQEKETFRAQMLTEMARMSIDDGLVMQIHPGSVRNHNRRIYELYGRDVGADIPKATNYVDALRPLLARFGNESKLQIILFTLDESTYSRELAPLAGHYPSLLLGPPWWFQDSPDGMLRFREYVTGTAGFYNTAGFNDDTRAFLCIPARHDMARRMDSAYLAKMIAEHRLKEEEAFELIGDLAGPLARKAYRL
jgi:glucuronate isomerase